MDPTDPHAGTGWPSLRMNGNPVFKWASFTMAKTAAEALDAVLADLDRVVLPGVTHYIARQGNTSAASIPLAIETLLESGEAHSGQTALIIGFGAGLVYAGQVIVLP